MTKQEYTFEILGGFLMNDNSVNAEYLADNIHVSVTSWGIEWYDAVKNCKKPLSLAKNMLCSWINSMLDWHGYKNYTCTYKQVKRFDDLHNNSINDTLDLIVDMIVADQKEYNAD